MLSQARREDLVVQEIEGETLVYDLRNHKAHSLNRTAAFIWKECDGEKTHAEIAERMSRRFGMLIDEDAVRATIDQLDQAKLLSSVQRGAKVSRREVTKKWVGAAALMIPTIYSIAAPTPAMAQTASSNCIPLLGECTPGGTPCCPIIIGGVARVCVNVNLSPLPPLYLCANP